jgi:hypothetical protein
MIRLLIGEVSVRELSAGQLGAVSRGNFEIQRLMNACNCRKARSAETGGRTARRQAQQAQL